MGLVEKYWSDVTIFCVGFTSLTEKGSKRKHRKMLVFDGYAKKEDVYVYTSSYFKDIDKILYVDEIADGQYLRESINKGRRIE